MPRFAVELDLVTGAYEAQDPSGEPEWPPAPYRFVAAMVAAAGPERTPGQQVALEALERCRPPVIHAAVLPEGTCIDPEWSVFVPSLAREKLGMRAQRLAERGVHPPVPIVRMAWREELTEEQVASLGELVSRITYLGRAGSFVTARVVDADADDVPEGLARWEPTPRGDTKLRTPFPGMLAMLDRDYALGRFAEQRLASVPATRYGHLSRRDTTNETAGPWDRLVLWRLRQGYLPQEFVLPATEALRAAVLSVLGDDAPSTITGHEPAGEFVGTHAGFMAATDVGHRYADGRILGFGVTLPPGVPAVPMPPYFVLWGHRFHLEEVDPDRAPLALSTWRWTQPASVWTSATPVALPWSGRRRDELALARRAIRAACRIAGFPEPVEVAVQREPLLRGSLPAARYERRRQRTDGTEERRRAVHARVRFAAPVRGPVALGPLRHFGLGVFVPEGGV